MQKQQLRLLHFWQAEEKDTDPSFLQTINEDPVQERRIKEFSSPSGKQPKQARTLRLQLQQRKILLIKSGKQEM